MNVTNKNQYLGSLKKELDKLNFVKASQFDSTIKEINDFDVFGFDIDFTLLIYNKKNMVKLIYESVSKFLINYKNYPKDISFENHKDFIYSFSRKNIVLDYIKGNALRLLEDKTILKCFHGKRELSPEEIKKNYPDGKFYNFDKSVIYSEFYFVVIDSFQIQNVALYMICVDLLDKKIINNISCYEDIIKHISDGMVFNYLVNDFENCFVKGYYFPEIYKHPELYLYKYNCKNILLKLRSLGKKIFLASNSNFAYVDFVLKYSIGKDYTNYFDLCFYKSGKPGFFHEPWDSGSRCFYSSDQTEIACDRLDDRNFEKIKNGNKCFSGGNYFLIENYFSRVLGKKKLKCIFVGDNIVSDCEVPSSIGNWESIYIYDDINLDFIGENPTNAFSPFDDSKNSEINYSNTFSFYFQSKSCMFALPNIEGFKFLWD